MSIVLDTSVVVALMDRDDEHHAAVAAWLADLDDDLVTTPLAVAEMDDFAGLQVAREPLWADLDRRAYTVRWWADALAETIVVARSRPGLGLTDASLVALAHRLGTDRIATTDHAHFRALMSAAGTPFILLPADAAVRASANDHPRSTDHVHEQL